MGSGEWVSRDRLALGEEAVRATAGGGGGGGAASGGCATFEDCVGAYADGEAWSDTSNAMSCWAAAGCDGYDAVDNSFSYDSYDAP